MAWKKHAFRADDPRTIPLRSAATYGRTQRHGPFVRGEIVRVDAPEERVVPAKHPRAIGAFDQGAAQGLWTFHYADGRKDCEGRFVQGKRQGLWIFWRPDGSLDCLGEYGDDLEDGWWTSFHADGTIEEQGAYLAGHKVGLWTYRTLDGHVETRDHDRPKNAATG